MVKSFGCFKNWALTLSSTSCCFVFYSFINPSEDFHVYFGLCSFVLCFDPLLASHFFVVCCFYNNGVVFKVYSNSQGGWKAIEGHVMMPCYDLQIWHVFKFTLKPFLLWKKNQKQIFFSFQKCISTSRLWELPWITIIDFMRIGTMRSSSLKNPKTWYLDQLFWNMKKKRDPGWLWEITLRTGTDGAHKNVRSTQQCSVLKKLLYFTYTTYNSFTP